MNIPGFPRLPLRYRLIWMLLWFAVLGALALFDGGSRTQAPPPTLPQLRHAWLSGGAAAGGDSTPDRARSVRGATTGAAFRQP